MVPDDQNMEAVIRGWIGEARVEDQRRIGELTAQVQRLQQARGAQQGQLCRSPQRTFWTPGWESHQSSVERNGKSGTSSSTDSPNW